MYRIQACRDEYDRTLYLIYILWITASIRYELHDKYVDVNRTCTGITSSQDRVGRRNHIRP